MVRTVIVSDQPGLLAALEVLRSAPKLAADIEANNQHAYRARMCVLQLCAAHPSEPAEEVYVLDTLAIKDLSPLEPLFRGEFGPLVFHDVAFDARVLASLGLQLQRAIDTSVHARFLGLRETGLASLLRARFGFEHEKAFQRHDWSLRPLTPEQLAYLSDDVRMLGPLAASLEHDASALGITEEIAEETLWALARAAEAPPVLPPHARIRQAKVLAPRQRALLRELALAREAHAERLDVPPTMLLPDRDLISAAQNGPRTMQELRRHVRAEDPLLEAELMQALKRGLTAKDVPPEEREFFRLPAAPPPADVVRIRSREQALVQWRQREAKARSVDLQVVLPGHVLALLARSGARNSEELLAVPGLGEVRVRRYATELVKVLSLEPALPAASEVSSPPTHVPR